MNERCQHKQNICLICKVVNHLLIDILNHNLSQTMIKSIYVLRIDNRKRDNKQIIFVIKTYRAKYLLKINLNNYYLSLPLLKKMKCYYDEDSNMLIVNMFKFLFDLAACVLL